MKKYTRKEVIKMAERRLKKNNSLSDIYELLKIELLETKEPETKYELPFMKETVDTLAKLTIRKEPESDKESKYEFMECDTCRQKPGSPYLCLGCLHNRKIISLLSSPKPKIDPIPMLPNLGKDDLTCKMYKTLNKRFKAINKFINHLNK